MFSHKRVLILANGDPPSNSLAIKIANASDLIVAVDGAIYSADSLQITPDILTGDFDSVDLDSIRQHYPLISMIETPDQEKADLEKAIDFVVKMGATSITVIGATGGRMDHTMANVTMLMNSTVPVIFEDDFGSMQYLKPNAVEPETATILAIEGAVGDTISLVTFEVDTTVSVSGAGWPLNHAHLLPGTRGISNISTTNRIIVTIHTGSVFVFHMNHNVVDRHSVIPKSSVLQHRL